MAPIHDIERRKDCDEPCEFGDTEMDSRRVFDVDSRKVFDNIPDDVMVFCYSCNTVAKGKDMANHLFLGRLDCRHCTVNICSCERFRNLFYSRISTCSHNKSGKHEFLKWQSICFDYLSYFLRKELVIDRFCKNMKGSPSIADVHCAVKDYISNLRVIEEYLPWKLGLKRCWKFLRSHNLTKENDTDGDSEKYDIESGNTPPAVKSSETSSVRREEIAIRKEMTHDNKPEGVCDTSKACESINKAEKARTLSEHRSHSTSCESHFSSMNSSQSNSQDMEDDIASQLKLAFQKVEEPCEELLSSYNVEVLDQSVEYVTVEDKCRDKDCIKENPGSPFQEGDQAEYENVNGKRKMTNGTFYKYERLKRPRVQSPGEFQPPDDIPDNRYLVLHFPTEGCPEECPNCYCEFCPSMLTVNCSTYISTIICSDCKLTIYVLPE